MQNQPVEETAGTVPQYPIESVDNALRLILLLGDQPTIRLTDASRYLGVASSTAHRMLAMLAYRGLVRQDPTTKVYGPGPALTGLAFSVIGRIDIDRLARPIMQALNDELNESIHLGALEGSNVRFLAAIESRRAVRVASRLGKLLPAHCTSLGKALLADLDSAELKRLYPKAALARVTSQSITSKDVLLRELAVVRRQGFATNREESEDGVASVAVAVRTISLGLRIGLSVSAPIGRIRAEQAQSVGTRLQAAAKELAMHLG